MLLLHHNPDGSWSPWSDSHRRIRVYKTRPVAAEAQGRWKWGIKNCELRMRGASPVRSASGVGVRHSPFSIRHLKWCSHVDLHHEPPPSQGGVQGSRYTLRALASVAGLAPARTCLKGRLRELLCIHGREVVPEAGIAPASPPLQGGANLSQLPGDCRKATDRSPAPVNGRPAR